MLRLPKTPSTPLGQPVLTGDYAVKINGKDCDVRSCRVSAMNFNRIWPGHQRPLDQTEIASYLYFESDGPAELQVTPLLSFKKAVLRPLSSGIALQNVNTKLTFTLPKPGFYVLELDDFHKALHIFFNAPEDFPEKDSATYYFGPGLHTPHAIHLKDNESVYIDRDAIVYGSIKAENAHNVRIFGHGVLSGAHEERVYNGDYDAYTNANIRMYDSSDIKIEGLILQDSPIWCTSFFGCSNIAINNVKIIGQWRYNTDGIDFCNCQNCHVTHSFLRAFDDVAVIKGIPKYSAQPCDDISFQDCVMWCDWGRTCEIGIETWAPEIKNIRFIDCDLIHTSDTALDIQNGGFARVHDIVFDNIRVEYQPYNTTEGYQATDHTTFHPRYGSLGFIRIVNHKFQLVHQSYGQVDNVLFKDIHVSLEDGTPRPLINMRSFSGEETLGHCWAYGFPVDESRRQEFGQIVLQNVTINDEDLESLDDLQGSRNEAAVKNVQIIK